MPSEYRRAVDGQRSRYLPEAETFPANRTATDLKVGLQNSGTWPQSVRTMATNIKKFLALRNALLTEKAAIEARLKQISQVIGADDPVPAPAPTVTGGKRTFSAATKAKMRVAQQARWAKIRGKTVKTSATAPKKKRKLSAAGRAAIVAAAKARWAKVKAAKPTASN